MSTVFCRTLTAVNGRHTGPILELLMLNLLCTRVVIVGTAYLINDVKDPKVFSGGSDSGQMTFWVGHMTQFTHDISLFELQIFKCDAG